MNNGLLGAQSFAKVINYNCSEHMGIILLDSKYLLSSLA